MERRDRHAGAELRRVPAPQQAPRHDVLLVDDGAAVGEAPPRPRPVRLLPLRRRHRRRPRTGAGRRAGRRPGGRSATASSPTSTPGAPTTSCSRPSCTPSAPSTSTPRRSAASCARWTMDLTVDRYETYDDLRVYMDGSAAVIGEMMLPILEPRDLAAATAPGPGPRRGVPADQLPARHRRGPRPRPAVRPAGGPPPVRRRPRRAPLHAGVRRADALRDRPLPRRCTATPRPGIAMLPRRSASCVAAAHDLYGRILDRIEAQGYDVFAAPGARPDADEARRRRPPPAAGDGPIAASAAAATAAAMIAFPLAAARQRGAPGDLRRRRRRAGDRRRRCVAGRRWGWPRSVVAATVGRRRHARRRARRHVDAACRSAATSTPAGCGPPSPGCRWPCRWRGGRWPCRHARSPTPRSAAARRRGGASPLGAVALTAWDLFLDPQMTAEGYWRWPRRRPLPGHPAVQLRRLAGDERGRDGGARVAAAAAARRTRRSSPSTPGWR